MEASTELDISPDVLFGITQLALDKVEGLSPTTPPVRMGEILTGRRAKGIQIERKGKKVQIFLNVRVLYGLSIPVISKEAQKAIRESVTSMTGLEVETVAITVEAIDVPEGLPGG